MSEMLRFENGTDALRTNGDVINRGETFGNDFRELKVVGFTAEHNIRAKNMIGEVETVSPNELTDMGRLNAE